MYESRSQSLVSWQHFVRRLWLHAGLALAMLPGLMLTPIIHRLLHKFHWG